MPSKHWNIFAKRITTLETRFRPAILKIIVGFRKDFIKDLKENGISAARNNLSGQSMNADISKALISIYRTAGLTGARLQYAELSKHLKEVEKKAAGFGRNEQWVQGVMAYLRFHALKFVSNITETMREDILKVLEKGINEGWSIDQIVKQLQTSNIVIARAKVIARTEIVRAANVGHAVAAQSMPFEVDKEWSAARDHRTRHSHQKVNGNVTDELGTFKVAIYKGDKNTGLFDDMQYPGDPNASAGNTINCRCKVLYHAKRDSNGKIIMRDQNTARIIPMNTPQRYTPAQIAAQLKANVTIGV